MTRSNPPMAYLMTSFGQDRPRKKRRVVVVDHGPTAEEVEKRLAASGGLFARLSPEKLEALRAMNVPHPEISGVPGNVRRR
jgi:hypothetical protein